MKTTIVGPALVRVLTTGGTIASRRGGNGVRATDGPEDVLDGVTVDGVRVESAEVLRVGGYRMSEAELREVASAAVDAADGAAGVVITHGTDTMEESAFLTDVLHAGEAPIVFCGAQLHAGEPDRDGPRNLRDAIRLAAAPETRGLGTAICMAGRAWPARHAVKVDTLALDAFGAPMAGPLATVHAGRVRVLARLPARAVLPREVLERPLPRVDVVMAVAGADGALVSAALSAGACGIVVVAFGTGNVPPAMADTLREAIAGGVPVLVTSRCAAGPTLPVYGGPGGGAELARAGAVFGGPLRPSHARLLLAAALACGGGARAIRGLIGPWI